MLDYFPQVCEDLVFFVQLCPRKKGKVVLQFCRLKHRRFFTQNIRVLFVSLGEYVFSQSPDSDFFKLSKRVQQLVKPILKFSIFELKSLFISCKFNIPGVIAFYAFLRQLKNHNPVDSVIIFPTSDLRSSLYFVFWDLSVSDNCSLNTRCQ